MPKPATAPTTPPTDSATTTDQPPTEHVETGAGFISQPPGFTAPIDTIPPVAAVSAVDLGGGSTTTSTGPDVTDDPKPDKGKKAKADSPAADAKPKGTFAAAHVCEAQHVCNCLGVDPGHPCDSGSLKSSKGILPFHRLEPIDPDSIPVEFRT